VFVVPHCSSLSVFFCPLTAFAWALHYAEKHELSMVGDSRKKLHTDPVMLRQLLSELKVVPCVCVCLCSHLLLSLLWRVASYFYLFLNFFILEISPTPPSINCPFFLSLQKGRNKDSLHFA